MIFDTKTINKGFTNSTGWNLKGRKGKSIHLLEPFISTPKTNVKTSNNIEIKNK